MKLLKDMVYIELRSQPQLISTATAPVNGGHNQSYSTISVYILCAYESLCEKNEV